MSEFEQNQNEEITESVSEAAEEVTEAAESAAETVTEAVEEAPKKKAAVHMTASAAALNADGEGEIRRRKPRQGKQVKQAKHTYEKKKGL